MGLDPDDIETLLGDAAAAPIDELEIWPENWPTVLVFLALSTQWKREIPAMSDRVLWHGIPHSEIEPTLRLLGYAKQGPKIFAGLKTMEAEALKLLNESKS
jgi:hypothetical protein